MPINGEDIDQCILTFTYLTMITKQDQRQTLAFM